MAESINDCVLPEFCARLLNMDDCCAFSKAGPNKMTTNNIIPDIRDMI